MLNFGNEIADGILAVLLDSTVKGTVVPGVLLILLRCFKSHTSASLRHILRVLSLIFMVVQVVSVLLP